MNVNSLHVICDILDLWLYHWFQLRGNAIGTSIASTNMAAAYFFNYMAALLGKFLIELLLIYLGKFTFYSYSRHMYTFFKF